MENIKSLQKNKFCSVGSRKITSHRCSFITGCHPKWNWK